MKVLFRVDGSNTIGSGHFMRCMVLAKELQRKQCSIEFICSNLKDNLNFLIKEEGFLLTEINLDSKWTQEIDYNWVLLNYKDKFFDVLIIDHYGIDQLWEQKIRPIVKKILVIDDLANRKHDCDYILDQNFLANMEHRYDNYVSSNTAKFLGASYALLREEFLENASQSTIRDMGLNNLLITFGGGGLTTTIETIKVLEALIQIKFTFKNIDVVIGKSSPEKEKIIDLVNQLQNTTLHIQAQNMSELMMKADLCIGAAGVTSWERCFLSLPALVVECFDNQKEVIKFLEEKKAIIFLGRSNQTTVSLVKENIEKLLTEKETLKNLSLCSKEIMNLNYYRGATFIAEALMGN